MTSLNLNGNLWAKSDNVGKQLIQKLGWSEGEGLGRNKQGSINHVKVSLKNDRDGLGMKSDKFSHNSGLLQTIDFDMLLKSKCAEKEGFKAKNPVPCSMSRPKFGRAVRKDYFAPLNNDAWTQILGKPSVIESKPDDSSKVVDESDNKFITKKITVLEYFENAMKQRQLKLSSNLSQIENSEMKVEEFSEAVAELNDRKIKKTKRKSNIQVEVENHVDQSEQISEISQSDSPKRKRAKLSDPSSDSLNLSEKPKKSKRKKNKEPTIETSEVSLVVDCKKSEKKSKKKISLTIEEKIAESEIMLNNIGIILANEPAKIEKSTSKKIVHAIELKAEPTLSQTESKIKLSNTDMFLTNEPAKIEKNKSKKIVHAIELKTESTICKTGVKVLEMAQLITSPLDSSNIKDIKGYAYQ